MSEYRRGYGDGQDQLARALLRTLSDCLSPTTRDTASAEALSGEISESRRVLRDLCEEFGDLDWSDDLHLADVIDKHLGRHLREARKA